VTSPDSDGLPTEDFPAGSENTPEIFGFIEDQPNKKPVQVVTRHAHTTKHPDTSKPTFVKRLPLMPSFPQALCNSSCKAKFNMFMTRE